MTPSLTIFYSWTAYISAALTILTFITGILFFSIGQPFGVINDISSVFQVLFILPLVFLWKTLLPQPAWLVWLAFLSGVAGILTSAWGQSLLVFGKIDFNKSQKYFPAGAAIGLWLMITNALMVSKGTLPQLLLFIGMLAGSGYILTVIGFLKGGQNHWLFITGALVLAISYPVWAIWLGHRLQSGILLVMGV